MNSDKLISKHLVVHCRNTLRGATVIAVALASTLFAAGCSSGNTGPTVTGHGLSLAARDLLDSFMGTVRLNSYKTNSIDWTKLDAEARDLARGAQHAEELNSAFQHVLTVLNDRHSRYVSKLGTAVRFPPTGCSVPDPHTPTVPPGIGYVRVRGFAGTTAEATAFADALQDSLRLYDKPGIAGWIVDLRNNTGGNMWPMLAGVGPLLGASRVGFFRTSSGQMQPWDYVNGAALSSGAQIQKATQPYVVRDPGARIAVLINKSTASSGEAIAVAFKNRPNTRFFGTETCGLATAIQGYKLVDNSDLFLAVALMADRTGTTYEVTVEPDEQVSSDTVVERAVNWLRQVGIQSESGSQSGARAGN